MEFLTWLLESPTGPLQPTSTSPQLTQTLVPGAACDGRLAEEEFHRRDLEAEARMDDQPYSITVAGGMTMKLSSSESCISAELEESLVGITVGRVTGVSPEVRVHAHQTVTLTHLEQNVNNNRISRGTKGLLINAHH